MPKKIIIEVYDRKFLVTMGSATFVGSTPVEAIWATKGYLASMCNGQVVECETEIGNEWESEDCKETAPEEI